LGHTVPEKLVNTTVTGETVQTIVFVVKLQPLIRRGKRRTIFFIAAARNVSFSASPPKSAI
jgi:hypothetical protein